MEALYDCDGDEDDELTFVTGEIIQVTGNTLKLNQTQTIFYFQDKKMMIGGLEISNHNLIDMDVFQSYLFDHWMALVLVKRNKLSKVHSHMESDSASAPSNFFNSVQI